MVASEATRQKTLQADAPPVKAMLPWKVKELLTWKIQTSVALPSSVRVFPLATVASPSTVYKPAVRVAPTVAGFHVVPPVLPIVVQAAVASVLAVPDRPPVPK